MSDGARTYVVVASVLDTSFRLFESSYSSSHRPASSLNPSPPAAPAALATRASAWACRAAALLAVPFRMYLIWWELRDDVRRAEERIAWTRYQPPSPAP